MTRCASKTVLAQTSALGVILVTAMLFLVGCSGGESEDAGTADATETQDAPDATDATNSPNAQETPAEGIASIIALYEARDFSTLFRTRYAEINKAESEEQIQSLIDRFALRFESDEALDAAIATYTSVLELTPELSEDGAVATFQLDEGFIKLSKMANGTWGFHL